MGEPPTGMRECLEGCGKTILIRETGGTGKMREGSRSNVRGFRNFESRLSRMSRSSCTTVCGAGELYQQPVRVGEARTYRGRHRYGGDLGGTLGFPVKLGLHTIPTLDPLMNHIPSGR